MDKGNKGRHLYNIQRKVGEMRESSRRRMIVPDELHLEKRREQDAEDSMKSDSF